MNMEPNEPLIDATEAGRFLKLHPVTVREFARQGRIPAVQIGRAWRFSMSRLIAWVAEQEGRKS
jgi:excisionase family DNA binding protein